MDEVARHRRLRRERRGQRRVEERRRDRVHPHAAADPLERERAGQLDDAALRRQVGARVRVGDEAADRGDVDDAARCPARASARPNAWQVRNVPFRLSARIASNRSSGKSSAGQRKAVPALLTSTSTRAELGDDRGDGAVDGRRVGDVRSARSRRAARRRRSSARRRPRASSSTSTTAIAAPACASPAAIAAPSPLAPPVTRRRDRRVRRASERGLETKPSRDVTRSCHHAASSRRRRRSRRDDVVDLGQHRALERGRVGDRRVLRRDAHRRRAAASRTPRRPRARRPRSRSRRRARPR